MTRMELPETCKVSCEDGFGKLVPLVGFIIKIFVTMHGHMNVKFAVLLPELVTPLTESTDLSPHQSARAQFLSTLCSVYPSLFHS